ncbi:uL15 family ribosomal protein [Candidatus Pacearchaeota archaeon]|nr:uL15 family ribosomal protein [Candidatus Pacearchaeota archaeon]
MIKTHRRKKIVRMRGKGAGSHGWGFRKSHRKSGHRGGKGMAGSGKRADQKKTLVIKLYGNAYFGKQGITSKKTERDKRKRINLFSIGQNLASYGKKEGDKWIINLENYKILAQGEVTEKLVIKALEASKSAIEKVKKAGGEIILSK